MEIQTKFSNAITELNSADYEALKRIKELGEGYNFQEAVSNLVRINDDLKQVFENANIIRVSNATSNKIADIADRASKFIGEIKKFVLVGNESNARNQHTQIHENIKNLYEEELNIIPALIERINILKLKPNEIDGQIQKAKEAISQIEKIKDDAQNQKDNIDKAIQEVRDALGKEGSLISISDFKNQAGLHKNLARKWLLGVLAMIALTLILTIFLFTGFGIIESLKVINGNIDNRHLIQLSILRIILLSIAYLLIYQTIKNYKINRHLYVANKHRQLVLSVYPLMAKAAATHEQSNIIVDQAAKSVFNSVESGYLDGDDGPKPINLTEVINKFSEK